MNKKLVLILATLGCGSVIFLTVIISGAAYIYYQGNRQQLDRLITDQANIPHEEPDVLQIGSAHAYAYVEIGAHYLGDRMKAAHPDRKIVLFCAAPPADQGKDGVTVDIQRNEAIQRGLAQTYGDAVTTVYVEVEPLIDADYTAEAYDANYPYKVNARAFVVAIGKADTHTVAIWTLPVPHDFFGFSFAFLPEETAPAFVLFGVDTTHFERNIASGRVEAAVDVATRADFDYAADIPADRDAAFSALYRYIDAASLPALLKEHPDYFAAE